MTHSLYLIAFHPGGHDDNAVWYALRDWDSGGKYTHLQLGVHGELGSTKPRLTLNIGKPQLTNAIYKLSGFKEEDDINMYSEHLLQIAQVVPEAVRFSSISKKIASIYETEEEDTLGVATVNLQNDFDKECLNLSKNLLKAIQGQPINYNDLRIVLVVKELPNDMVYSEIEPSTNPDRKRFRLQN